MKNILIIGIVVLSFFLFSFNTPVPRSSIYNKKINQTLTPPEYPGGEEAFHQYLNSNIHWPKGNDVQGTVIIGFTVEKTGYLTDFVILKKVEKSFDDEALRVVEKSPRWIPATRDGKPIKSKYSVPIQFTVTVIR